MLRLISRRCASTLPANLNLGNRGAALLDDLRPRPPPPPPQHAALLMRDVVVPILNTDAKLTLPWRVFNEPLRVDVLHAYVKWQRANKRQLGIATKTRAEVRGSGRKIRQQKGSGKARVGSIRSPIRRGGSKAHGPKRRDFSQDLNKSTRRLALRVALSQKLREHNLVVTENLSSDGKTKHLAATLANWGLARSVLLVDYPLHPLLLRAARNIPYVDVLSARGLNVYSMLKRKHTVLTTDAVHHLISRLAPS